MAYYEIFTAKCIVAQFVIISNLVYLPKMKFVIFNLVTLVFNLHPISLQSANELRSLSSLCCASQFAILAIQSPFFTSVLIICCAAAVRFSGSQSVRCLPVQLNELQVEEESSGKREWEFSSPTWSGLRTRAVSRSQPASPFIAQSLTFTITLQSYLAALFIVFIRSLLAFVAALFRFSFGS